MAEYIVCRNCDPLYCDNCNIYILSKMLFQGKLDCLMDEHHTVVNTPENLRSNGKWEWRGGIPWCSNCGKMPSGYSYDGDSGVTDFCGSCGAYMRGENV